MSDSIAIFFGREDRLSGKLRLLKVYLVQQDIHSLAWAGFYTPHCKQDTNLKTLQL